MSSCLSFGAAREFVYSKSPSPAKKPPGTESLERHSTSRRWSPTKLHSLPECYDDFHHEKLKASSPARSWKTPSPARQSTSSSSSHRRRTKSAPTGCYSGFHIRQKRRPSDTSTDGRTTIRRHAGPHILHRCKIVQLGEFVKKIQKL